MAINLSAEDHLAMDAFLGSVLDAFAAGDVSRKEAVTVLAILSPRLPLITNRSRTSGGNPIINRHIQSSSSV